MIVLITQFRIMENLDCLAIENFREYLKIPSVHPNIDYGDCIKFLEKQAKSLDLKFRIYQFYPGKPIVILSWIGKEPNLPTIMLNSHMDVVPVYEEEWSYPPFGAVMDEKGNIYARGTQDMKSVGIQYLEAVRRLRKDGVALRRTIHISFVPDEETGGDEGMKVFVKSEEFKALNVGFGLDEGIASPNDVFGLFNGERPSWTLLIHCPGQPGHGSLLLDNTAGEKVRKMLDRFYEFREREKKKLNDNPALTVGDVTTVNLTQIKGGIQSNVIPPELTLTIDCRISLTRDATEFEKTLRRWSEEAGKGVWIEFIDKGEQIPPTKLDETNLFWVAFKKISDKMNLKLRPQIFTGGTDIRYVRALNIPALGFSPMNNTPILLHDNDEFLNKDVFLRGIGIYYELIAAVANADEK